MSPDDLIAKHFQPNPLQVKALERLNMATLGDLLYYFPFRYGDQVEEKLIEELQTGDEAVVYGKVVKAGVSKAWKKKIPMGEVVIEDATGRIKAVWFHQAYLAKKVAVGQIARLQGKVLARRGGGAERKKERYLVNPEIESANGGALDGQSLFQKDGGVGGASNFLIPVYSETRSLSSSWFHHHLKKILSGGAIDKLVDPIPTKLLKKYNLPGLATALVWIHSPKKESDALAARKRFAFQEIFFIQLSRLQAKQTYQQQASHKFKTSKKTISDFTKRLPFKLTSAQSKAITQITSDFDSGGPMTRLLEGDVGSGKTAVAVAASAAVVQAGLEVAYMAPTEILAKQHFESFIDYFNSPTGPDATAGANTQVGLITGKGCYKFPSKIWHGPDATAGVRYTNISRAQLLKWVANGEIPILVGTHALITKTVKFKKLGLVIIDEQHRFGVMQRAKLARKNEETVPHLLSMTATPIPRTLALTVYGDLDLTLLDEMPAGRKAIITKIIREDGREIAYKHIQQELEKGRQAYVICPRIDEPDPTKALALRAKSAKSEQVRLQEKIFPKFDVGLVHSKLKPADKAAAMEEFTEGDADILVATSVVEVGVNVPNATVIVIEGAERFGLAQLHQLRGRVWRSNHQAYCYLFTDTGGKKSLERLKALQTAKNGFELAELDLALRGAGELNPSTSSGSGRKARQWGLSDLGMEAIKNIKMVEAARTEARELLSADPELKRHPLIHQKLADQKTNETHWE
ncbi:MAG: ATP-dependent DNA helicase RecG [Patescibacteria group bacterium]|nr:ATP-dependent DNA helicase RecG [Patescibacteria group bacterium]